jgi:cell division protein FtsX
MRDEGVGPSPAGAILLVTAGTGGIRTLNEDEHTSLPRVSIVSPKPSPSVKSQGRISNQIYKQTFVEREEFNLKKLTSIERRRSVTMMVGQETAADAYSDQK